MLTDIGVAEGEVEKGLGSVNTVDVVRDGDADANASKVSKGTDAPLITKDAILGELGARRSGRLIWKKRWRKRTSSTGLMKSMDPLLSKPKLRSEWKSALILFTIH